MVFVSGLDRALQLRKCGLSTSSTRYQPPRLFCRQPSSPWSHLLQVGICSFTILAMRLGTIPATAGPFFLAVAHLPAGASLVVAVAGHRFAPILPEPAHGDAAAFRVGFGKLFARLTHLSLQNRYPSKGA